MISDKRHSVYYFSSADDADDADLKDYAMILINKNPCYPCYLRMENE